MADALTVKSPDGITRSLSEHYDGQRDVEQDPYGAWLAIHIQRHSRPDPHGRGGGVMPAKTTATDERAAAKRNTNVD